MEEKRNVPKLRFPGFTDSWEQRRLGELVEETYGGGTPKTSVPEYWGGDIPWIQSSNVIEGELFNIDIPKAITDKGLRESAAILIPGSSIAVVTHVGVGKLVYLPFSFTTSQDFVSLSRLKTNSIFLCYALFRRLQTEINMVQGSAIKGITKAELLDKRIDIPHDVEQTQIGAFFQKLDSLIALHQRELDHVKELKKGLLQKMFPKEGTNVPELRFPGFTDPWEQRRLGEVAHRVTRKNEEGMSDLPLTISAQHGLVDQRDFFNSQVASRDMRGYYLLERGEFAYNKSTSSDSPWGAIKRLTEYEKGCLSTLYICFGLDEGDPDFLVTYYETSRWHRGIRMIAAEGARNHGLLNIAPGDFFETELTLPGKIEEQTAIGALFAKLDSLIALHQRELDHVKELKKGLLQQMFV
ncbi:restriction endonuclease subunit S [Adlercreutzia equolifaciens]|uniref:restriction endonuclease subunit S n=1 Tax=Adlercreutzia equolifaciens TaxID=446660 RepID=UPI003AF18EC2